MCVRAEISKCTLPTYPLGEPEKNPLFFEKRVYQGSNGKVYPLPFIDKVYDEPVDREYQLVTLENEYVYLEMLPEIGGRIFKGQDKTNEDYDFFYRQDAIKPALVGLAGPWLSGGVEFNWPQHHRPGTYMPTDVFIEEEADGARTVWMSEIDPLQRMKGMHGVRLRPGSSLVELRVRLFNRTPVTQTFLWWANVAAKVHDNFQSFFPPDVHYVADHAVRAMSSFPEAKNDYYGVDYAGRSGANDLSWYKNIPVPTSYMVCDTQGGFFGGYDFNKQGGFVHVANRHLSPGKKQWTWGNHEFGWAWDRELTDEGGPYVELMAGVYTDNQPDFSYLLPYETKTFSQYWWPIQKTGPVQEANEEMALRLVVRKDRTIEAALNVSRVQVGLRIRMTEADIVILDTELDLAPGDLWASTEYALAGESAHRLEFSVYDQSGKTLGRYRPAAEGEKRERRREVAVEPEEAEAIESVEKLFLVGEHLEQYRHPTRDPEVYWKEGLKRDAGDARCHLALGKAALKRGEFVEARTHFDAAIARYTRHHPNPSSGEAHYYAGLSRRYLGQFEEAYALFFRATWNYEWRSAAYYELGCIDFAKGRFTAARNQARSSLETNTKNNKAGVLLALALMELGELENAREALDEVLKRDALDPWANYEAARQSGGDLEAFRLRFRNDAQTVLDLVFEYASLGAFEKAESLLEWHLSAASVAVATPNPLERSQMTLYCLAWLRDRMGKSSSSEVLGKANAQSSDYFFPSRWEEQLVLEWACSKSMADLPRFGLGNYYCDKRRHEDAIRVWVEAVEGDTKIATVHRNLGIAYWNCRRDSTQARAFYQGAIELDQSDARLLFEYDQLRKRIGDDLSERLATLEANRDLVMSRDDACVEYVSLLNESFRHEDALALLTSRRFHPWEGGEGRVLRQFTAAKIGLGKASLKDGDFERALSYFEEAFDTPENLGEAYHFLQAKADVNFWIGKTLKALGREEAAAYRFEASAREKNDFQDMEVVAFSEVSYFQGLSLIELGREVEARELFEAMVSYVETELGKEAKIDYFATSLPNLLVFEDDIQTTRDDRLEKLRKLALSGISQLA
ncbi:tetratricopeptide repeat domain protein [Verrucomicrobiia bacterium DG1235]|nr:tetratricopeptide repeat domain protein [Verrucomicrobiae bacterium DG1235]